MARVAGLITARKGSKGLPGKNRILFPYTAGSVMGATLIDEAWVSTDDPVIAKQAEEMGIHVHERPDELAKDDTPIKPVVEDFLKARNPCHMYEFYNDPVDLVCVLYPTYPTRSGRMIDEGIKVLREASDLTDSVIGMKKPKTHPYLCYERSGMYIKRIIGHSLYRRQDYPEAFEICHAVCVVKVSSLGCVDNQLVGSTVPYFIYEDIPDIDTPEDLEEWKNGR